MSVSRRSVLGGLFAGAALPASTLATPAKAGINIDGFKGAINATDLDAVPDLGADQTDVLQRAIDVANRVGNPLFLPPGRYVASGLNLPSGTHIVGVPGASRLIYPGRSGLLIAENAEDISLTSLVIEGHGSVLPNGFGLVTLVNTKGVTIDGCRIIGAAGNGLQLDGISGRVINTEISHCSEAAIFSTNAKGLRISGNTVTDCANNGILVWRSIKGDDGTIVTENRIERIGAANGGEGQWGNGVNIYRADSVTVANNRIKDCAYSAVRSNAGSACQVLGNNCDRIGEVAIYAEFGYEGAVIANNILDQVATGISMTNFSTGGRLSVCTGNIVRNLFTRDHYDKRGVGIAAEADTVITGNVVENAPTAGIVIGWGPHLRDVSATGNVIRDATIGIGVSVAEGAGSAVIADNLVSGTRSGAIVGMAWDEIVARDLASVAADRFPQLQVGRNRVS
ncbi:MAG: TIGR03808 family TAT-translocated repetitive protein [Pseudomonadota bacterium]